MDVERVFIYEPLLLFQTSTCDYIMQSIINLLWSGTEILSRCQEIFKGQKRQLCCYSNLKKLRRLTDFMLGVDYGGIKMPRVHIDQFSNHV